MLKQLTTLESGLSSRKKYIWNTNRDSLVAFSLLAFRNIKIDGFVTSEKMHIGENFLNTEVIGIETLQQSSAVLILSDECKKHTQNETLSLPDSVEVRYLSELLRFNSELSNQNVLVYGTGSLGGPIKDLLEGNNAEVPAFLTLDPNTPKVFMGKPVMHLTEIETLQDPSSQMIVLAETNITLRDLIADFNEKIGVKNTYFINELLDTTLLKQSNLFLFIDNAYKRGRRIYLTGKGTAFSNKIKEILTLYSVPVAGYVTDEDSTDEAEKNIYDLYYEGLEDIFVIVTSSDRSKTEEIGNKLEAIGMSIDQHDYVGIYPIQWKGHPPTCDDRLLDYSIEVEANLPGVRIIGNGGKKIIILGGSTSTHGAFKPKSWVEFFYEKLSKISGDITIYNLAHEGHDVTMELLRLLRDGHILKPDYVISMSGVNNLACKENMVNQFNTEMPYKWLKALSPDIRILSGIETNESLFTFWKRTQKIIKAVSEIYGATYIGFLQPTDTHRPHKSLFDSMLMENESTKISSCFLTESAKDDFYINLQRLFWDREGMYIDNCHYSTAANELLANAVIDAFLKSENMNS